MEVAGAAAAAERFLNVGHQTTCGWPQAAVFIAHKIPSVGVVHDYVGVTHPAIIYLACSIRLKIMVLEHFQCVEHCCDIVLVETCIIYCQHDLCVHKQSFCPQGKFFIPITENRAATSSTNTSLPASNMISTLAKRSDRAYFKGVPGCSNDLQANNACQNHEAVYLLLANKFRYLHSCNQTVLMSRHIGLSK